MATMLRLEKSRQTKCFPGSVIERYPQLGNIALAFVVKRKMLVLWDSPRNPLRKHLFDHWISGKLFLAFLCIKIVLNLAFHKHKQSILFCYFVTCNNVPKLNKLAKLRGDWIPQNGCFFGKLPNGLAPPPRPFLEITLRFFCESS